MRDILFMFPGQGSQSPGMTKDIYDAEPLVRDLFAHASDFAGMDMANVCFESTPDQLKRTENAQPALFVTAYSICSVLRERGKLPNMVMGHSLGEYTAAAVAGMLSFKDAVKLVVSRGKLMSLAGQKKPGAMAALIGLSTHEVEQVCSGASSLGTVAPANYNSPQQIVISGEDKAVERAMALAKSKGAKRVLPLQVSGAFHSALMQDIAQEFQKILQQTRFMDSTIPVISNVTAEAVTRGETMRELLLKQLVSPVQWVKCVENATSMGATIMCEVGPGKVLAGLVKRIAPSLEIQNVGSLEELHTYLAKN